MNTKEVIINTISDLIGSFLYYDRKEDEDLPLGIIEEAIKNKVVTVAELVVCFEKELIEGLKE